MSEATFDTPEETLVKELGVPRSTIRTARVSGALVRDSHWTVNGSRVLWSQAGVVCLVRHLGFDRENQPPATAAPEPQVLTVASSPIRAVNVRGTLAYCHFGNPSLIRARTKTGELVYVRVPDSSKFTPIGTDGKPMELLARLQGGQWCLAQRAPRWRGRW